MQIFHLLCHNQLCRWALVQAPEIPAWSCPPPHPRWVPACCWIDTSRRKNSRKQIHFQLKNKKKHIILYKCLKKLLRLYTLEAVCHIEHTVSFTDLDQGREILSRFSLPKSMKHSVALDQGFIFYEPSTRDLRSIHVPSKIPKSL